MRPIHRWLLSLLVAGALFYIIFQFVDFGEVMSALSATEPEWLLAALFFLAFERWSAAMRMKILADKFELSLSTWKIFEISTVATFYGTFAPGELAGGAVRWYRMSKPTGHRAQVFAAIVVERLVDTIVLVLCGLAFWFLDSPPFDTRLVNVTLLAVLGVLVTVLGISLSVHTSTASRWVLQWIPWKKARERIIETVEKILVSIRMLRELTAAQLSKFVILSLARTLLAIAMLLCFAIGLGMSIEFVTIGWIRSILNVIVMLPVSFSGLGVREASMVLLLKPYGVPAAQAVAFSLLNFLVYIVMATAGGLFELRNTLFSQPERASAGRAPTDRSDRRP